MHIHSQCGPPAIHLSPGGSTGAAAISYIKLYSGTQKHAQILNLPRVYAVDCTTTLHSIQTTVDGSPHSNQQLQLGRSSVRGWTRQWPFGIPRRSAERGEAFLKDTFSPLLHSNSIVLTGQRCPTVCQHSNLRVIEFPISHPSIMHLVSTRKEANALPHAGRRQKSAMTGQRDLLLPDDGSLASPPYVIPRDELLQNLDYCVTSDSIMTVSSSLIELLSLDADSDLRKKKFEHSWTFPQRRFQKKANSPQTQHFSFQ